MWAGEDRVWWPFEIVGRSSFTASGRISYHLVLSERLLPEPHLWCLLVLGKSVHPGELHCAWHVSGEQDWRFWLCFGIFKEIKKHGALLKVSDRRWCEDLVSQAVGPGHTCAGEKKTAEVVADVELRGEKDGSPERGQSSEPWHWGCGQSTTQQIQKQPKRSRTLEGSGTEALSGRQTSSQRPSKSRGLADRWTEPKRAETQKPLPS